MMIRPFFLTTIALVAAAACARAPESEPESEPAPAVAGSASTTAAAGLTGRSWTLVELNGQPLPALERVPNLLLGADGQASGFGGCNTFSGPYTLDATAMRIRFSPLATTSMACIAGMEVEHMFYEMLKTVDNYSLTGNQLALNRARMAPLARFEAR
jgi:heat shock protein HslJ